MVPHVPVWILGGTLEAAKGQVRQAARSAASPRFLAEYLEAPGAEFVRARVVANGDETGIQVPDPGSAAFERLLEALNKEEYVFLGQEESVWHVTEVRLETSPSGIPHIEVELTRLKAVSGREVKLREIVERMRVGVAADVLESFRRADLHDRGAR